MRDRGRRGRQGLSHPKAGTPKSGESDASRSGNLKVLSRTYGISQSDRSSKEVIISPSRLCHGPPTKTKVLTPVLTLPLAEQHFSRSTETTTDSIVRHR